jgi:hypothetical protein
VATEAPKTYLNALTKYGVTQTNSVPTITQGKDSRNTDFQQNGDVNRKILVVQKVSKFKVLLCPLPSVLLNRGSVGCV